MCLRRSEIHKRIQFSLIYIKWNDDWGIKQYGNVFLKIRLYSTDSTKQWPFVLTLVLQIVSSYHKHRVLRDGDCGARHQPGRHEREQPGQGGGEGQRGGQGFWSEENWFPICELRHRYFSATSAWTWLGTQWSLCAVTCSVGRVYIRSDRQLIRWGVILSWHFSGWRLAQTDKSARYARLGSAGTRSYLCTEGGTRTEKIRGIFIFWNDPHNVE